MVNENTNTKAVDPIYNNYIHDLANKCDNDFSNLAPNHDGVIEYNVNADGSWYRRYKSGWLEQGGITDKVTYGQSSTVIFVKPFFNVNYYMNVVKNGTYSGQGEADMCVYDKTTTSAKINQGFANASNIMWHACGQGV